MDSESFNLPLVGISACLLGQRVRYDGGHKLQSKILKYFHHKVRWVAICPETECGMDTPREPMHLQDDGDNPSLVACDTGRDLTWVFKKWLCAKLKDHSLENLSGMLLKSKSPSCAIHDVPVYTDVNEGTVLVRGAGLFARAFMKEYQHVPVVDETELDTVEAMDEFYGRILECS